MKSSIYSVLDEKRTHILSAWQSVVASRYGSNAPVGQAAVKRFSYPIEHVLNKGMSELLDWLIDGNESTDVQPYLEDICKLRAVQDYSPANALSFIFDLKDVTWTTLKASDSLSTQVMELRDVEHRIDSLMLMAFDEYSKHRARIAQIRIDEMRRLGVGVSR
ncbi:MAG: RsbRD N-terminal domain-containing protein [Coriobacteriales bacterium]|jgi:hypothetical protein|nr:RsbRD N-terminal domain-containing protein [Coriobacteriales bacterium]